MMAAVCIAVYLAGYQTLAVGLFVLMVLSSAVLGKKAAPKGVSAGGITVSGAEMLEPIVIETTRGAPFRIPSYMKVRVKPNWGSNTWYEKALGRGLGRMTRWAYRPLSGSDYA